MKLIYRVLILLGVFVGSLVFFGKTMDESVFHMEKQTMEMNEASLPYICLRIGETEINRLHGYSSNLDEMLPRESITPLKEDQKFDVVITENSNIVKKVSYEISDVATGQQMESGSIIALEQEGENKIAGIRLKEELQKDTEYVAKITLITNQSKRIYYYTRIKVLSSAWLEEKIAFVREFHTKTFDKEAAQDLKRYLETRGSADQSSYAKVDIHSSLDMISWGTLEPLILFEELPQLTEFTKDTASVVLNYYITVKTPSGMEEYAVKEKYRFRYTAARTYLYNFERTMEEVFDPSFLSMSKSEFKIGITNETELQILPNKSNNRFAFVRGRELWTYDAAENSMIRVFSFRQENTDYIRDTYDQHGVKILNLYDDGTIDFIVYGYMNRGEYEGRVGIVLYRYNPMLLSIEEQLYLPVNTTYQMLEEELGELLYRSGADVFYFSIFDTLYSYNLVSKNLTVLAADAPEETVVFSASGKYAAWQELPQKAESIRTLLLETGEYRTIAAEAGEYIRLLGSIGENMIYGLVRQEDISVDSIGVPMEPMYTVKIADRDRNILKSYDMPDYYTDSVTVKENRVTLKRLKADPSTFSGYREASEDYIMNQPLSGSEYKLSKRVTDQMLTEYYISLPSYYLIDEFPVVENSKNTMILEDTTVRVMKPEEYANRYYAFAFGELILSSEHAGEVITAADEAAGTVIDSSGRILWQRGGRPSKAELSELRPVYSGGSLDSIQACLKMIFDWKSIDGRVQEYRRSEISISGWMKKNMKSEPLELREVTLEQALFLIGSGHPVLAMKGQNSAVLITAYDSLSVTFVDPAAGRTTRLALKEAEELFSEAGSLYISFYE